MQLPAARLTFNSCPTVDRAVKDVMQCLPSAVFTVKQVTQQSEYIFQVQAISRGVAQTNESVEVWVAMRRAFKVTMGLTRTMTSNLPVHLGSCVLSILRGKGPQAALITPPGKAESIHTRLS